MRLEMSTEVAAPAEKVWSVIEDVERWPEWTASMMKVERLDKGSLEVGSTARVKQPKLPVAVWRVIDLVPGCHFLWEASGPGLRTVGGHYVEPIDAGRSRAKLTLDQGGVLAGIAGLFWSKMTRDYVTMELEGLKRRSEGRG